jgi:hypothetical protein
LRRCKRCGHQIPSNIKVCLRCHEYKRKLWQNTSPEERKKDYERLKKFRDAQKDVVLTHYGKKCACCGETHEAFLTIDHINGGGSRHRREFRLYPSYKLYRWLISNRFPSGFQLLCFNCNIAKEHLGYCSHEKERNKADGGEMSKSTGHG